LHGVVWRSKNIPLQTRAGILLAAGFFVLNARYSNGNILSLWYRNQAIQKPKFISTYMTKTSMKVQSEIKSFWRTKLQQNSVGNLLAAWFSAFTLDIQKGIFWAFVIEIRRFKNPNSSKRIGLQLSWKIQSEIKSFWITESSRNLLGQKDLLIWFENWQCWASQTDWEFDIRTVSNIIATAAKSVFSAKTWVGILLTAGFSTFILDIQMGISWASDIEIRRFKNLNSSTRTGLQLSWRIQSEINSFWRTESGCNLVGQKGSPYLILKNWQCQASQSDWESAIRTASLGTQ